MARSIRLVTFGDSITQSYYPPYLTLSLALNQNAGLAGNTTADMLARVGTDVLAYAPTDVAILGGTNDIRDVGSGGLPLSLSLTNLASIIDQIRGVGATPWLLTIPPRTDQIARAMAFNAALPALALAHGATIVDIWPLLAATSGDWRPGYASGDGIHPSATGSAVIAAAVQSALLLPPSVAISGTPDTITAWVTDSAGTMIAVLDRSTASPFRRFALQAEINGPGVGSLEYHLDNDIVAAQTDLFAYGNLVWFRYRGKTRTWIVEERVHALDEGEHQSDWVRVAGRGVLQLLGDRTIWPSLYSDVNSNPSLWGVGGWSTKTSASAASAQKVVPVNDTTSGTGAYVGSPVEIVGGGFRQIGIIDSIVAGVSVTLVDNLAYTFPKGTRIRGAAKQWRRFVNRAAGEMLWDNITESNSRFATQIVRGTVETTGADGWTQDFRFDNQLDVVDAVTTVYGDVEMNGLTFNYYNAMGRDRTAFVTLEEGADVLRLNVQDGDRDSLSWVVAEGTGHAVFSYLAPKKKLTRAQRKTAARKAALTHRKAPAAPRKVILVKADYTLDLAAEAVSINRRREAFLDAKDISDPVQLTAMADAALEEHQVTEAVAVELLENRYKVDLNYSLGDWIKVVVPSRGFSENVRVVALTIAEDDNERVRAAIDVNTVTAEHLLTLAQGAKATASSLGVQNRQPMGQLVPYSFSGQGILDTGSPLYVYLKIPDRMSLIVEALITLSFRQFLAPATAASSGGGSTSGASSASSSGSSSASSAANGGGHLHTWALYDSDSPGAYTKRLYEDGVGVHFNLEVASQSSLLSFAAADHTHGIAHDHGIPHTHTTPNHTHGLTYGTFEETYPVSHSVTLKAYERVDTTWTLRGTFTTLTNDLEDVDLSSVLTAPGDWRLTIQSEAAQPNGGRLGCDVFGAIVGAIQSA